MDEFNTKQAQLQTLMAAFDLDAILLERSSSFAWVTCGGRAYVNIAASNGAAALLVTRQGRYLLTNNIEAPRLTAEEQLEDQGWEIVAEPWHARKTARQKLTAGLRLGADGPLEGGRDLSAELARLRATLSPAEMARFRELSAACAQAMDETAHSLQPGMSENEIAARLGAAIQGRGGVPVVNLIATDERVFRFRHPLPTEKKLARYAMLVLCGRRDGLVCSITRLVHFGPLSDELARKAAAVAAVDAAMIQATRPGRTLGDVFAAAKAAYAAQGYPAEWQFHHQGGPAGYEPREWLATPEVADRVLPGQAYAWNPSIAGTKSEDTILVCEAGNEVLTTIPGWPVVEAETPDGRLARPAILVL